ncbi:MAG: hypothetical protein EOO42_01810 [Flavobacteriales bacterium]|nr:MAG: hypothetical protein EOO42_01810 [Flavobacteriales bacterium]
MKMIRVIQRPLQLGKKHKEGIAFAISSACLFLFALSAYEKFTDLERFTAGLAKVKWIGPYAAFVAIAVPIVELIISVLLVIPATQKLGLWAFATLLFVFTLYIASMLLWAEKLPCHCNLILEKLSFGQHLVFNIGFILLALWGIYLMKKT